MDAKSLEHIHKALSQQLEINISWFFDILFFNKFSSTLVAHFHNHHLKSLCSVTISLLAFQIAYLSACHGITAGSLRALQSFDLCCTPFPQLPSAFCSPFFQNIMVCHLNNFFAKASSSLVLLHPPFWKKLNILFRHTFFTFSPH